MEHDYEEVVRLLETEIAELRIQQNKQIVMITTVTMGRVGVIIIVTMGKVGVIITIVTMERVG